MAGMRIPAPPPDQESMYRSYVIKSVAELREALQGPPLNQWEALLEIDQTATLFQSPVWCLPWYESYVDFEPRVLVVTRDSELAGVVPLAVETASGRLTFGGDNMTDYRDVVTRPECRREVVEELLSFYRRGNFPGVLHFGSTPPESETPGVLLSLSRSCGVHALQRSNYGWRWWPQEQTEDPLKKKSVRYPINYFRRQGSLEAEYIRSEEEWERFKEEFYLQHSVRQIFAGRPVSFNDSRKRAFFDRLFRTPHAHVTALRLNGQLIAGHFGAVYKDVLYWGAPSFDIRYRQYSPNLVLLVLTMKNTGKWDFTGVDLTIGKGDLKERFSTRRVDLPWIELYARSAQFYMRTARAVTVRAARRAVERVGGDETWEKRVKPEAEKIAYRLARVKQLGIPRSAGRVLRRLANAVGEHTSGIVFIAHPQDLRDIGPQLQPGEMCVYHDNELNDLARRDSSSDDAAREIAVKVRAFTDAVRTGRTFHTLLVNERLAAWGYSYWPQEPARLTEVGGIPLEFEPHSISMYDFYTLPEFRGRKLYQALLCWILKKRFAEGAERAYITVLEKNVPSRTAIERVGFRPMVRNEVTRLFKWRKLRSRSIAAEVRPAGVNVSGGQVVR